jgi:hypothetical protein
MSAGLDLVEPVVEPNAPDEYDLVGRTVLPAPASGNIGSGTRTAVTIQREQNEHDGHYVAFEFEDVKYRYSCFIASLAAGRIGVVPAPSLGGLDPCP